jgi:hypothetical protein
MPLAGKTEEKEQNSIRNSVGRNSDWLPVGRKGLEFESRYGQELFPLHVLQTGSVAHLQRVLGALSPEKKRLGREVDHLTPTSAEVKKMWIYTTTPLYAFMA